MYVIRKTTNSRGAIKPSSTATFAFRCHQLPEKVPEQTASQLPVVPINAIFHFRGLNLTLYQACLFQLLQVLRHCSLGYWQFLIYIAEIARIALGEKLEYRNTCRMPHCLCKTGQLFLLGVYFTWHIVECLSFAKIQTIFGTSKYRCFYFMVTFINSFP